MRNFILSSRKVRIFFANLLYPKFLGAVVLIAFDKKGQILLAEHAWKERARWRLPGGFVERKDKDFTTTLIREMKEELGVDLERGDLKIAATRKVSSPSRIDLFFLYKKPLTQKLKLDKKEIKEAKFFSLKDLPSTFAFRHKNVVEEVIKKSA